MYSMLYELASMSLMLFSKINKPWLLLLVKSPPEYSERKNNGHHTGNTKKDSIL